MAEFYGTVKGGRGAAASRCGTKASGITVSAQSWKGSIIIKLTDDTDHPGSPLVSLYHAQGSSMSGSLIYQGTINDLVGKVKSL